MAKAPDPSTVARPSKKQASAPVVKMAETPPASFMWAGQRLAFRPGDINATQDLEAYRLTGMSAMDILTALGESKVSLFGIAVLIWIARLQAGEKVTLEAQLAVTNVGTLDTFIESFSDEETVDSPPA